MGLMERLRRVLANDLPERGVGLILLDRIMRLMRCVVTKKKNEEGNAPASAAGPPPGRTNFSKIN